MRLIDAERFEVISFKDKSKEFAEGAQWLAEQIDNAPTVEAIPITKKAYEMFEAAYEAKLKADMAAMLIEIQIQFEEKGCKDMRDCWWLIEEKINALRGNTDVT